ncbi:hypothetical protein [Aurantiacibacter zhengii]|uniref:Uncharacterized protein n=1 Tax=Aurantiacibacter zhengii TaxID=2307003 RepID=A0A418NTF8_9SPHN|nr:hypothetical protein [Aurantiacibacter zhengii]RIV86784.1 hypothetical protein D2V07_08845 [Aurantiacibacter zhengii]
MLGRWADKFEWKSALFVGSVFAIIGVLRFEAEAKLLDGDNLVAQGFFIAGLLNLAFAWRNRPSAQQSEQNAPRIGK